MRCACWSVNKEHVDLQYFITFPAFYQWTLDPTSLLLTVNTLWFSVSQYLYCKSVIKAVLGFMCLVVECRNRHQGVTLLSWHPFGPELFPYLVLSWVGEIKGCWPNPTPQLVWLQSLDTEGQKSPGGQYKFIVHLQHFSVCRTVFLLYFALCRQKGQRWKCSQANSCAAGLREDTSSVWKVVRVQTHFEI